MAEFINTNMITLARESRGINQSELAEKIGITQTNLGKIERGEYGLSTETLQKLSECTNYPTFSQFYLRLVGQAFLLPEKFRFV